MNAGFPRSDPDQRTILIDLDPRQAHGIARAIHWYLTCQAGPLTPHHADLKALAVFLEDALPFEWRERMAGMVPAPLEDCA